MHLLAQQQQCLLLSMAAMAMQLHPQQGIWGGSCDPAARAVCAGREGRPVAQELLAVEGGGCSKVLS